MRQITAALLALCFCLLAACVGLDGAAPAASAPEAGSPLPPPVEPEYQLDAATAENTFAAEDGTEVAHYTYQLLTLAVANLESLSPESAQAAQRSAGVFNEKMIDLMEESADTGRLMGEDALSDYLTWGRSELYYYDETTASASRQGQVISVRLDNSSFTGGAHPNRYVSACLFDLHTGQFIDPIQVADDPETFRTGAAQALLEQAEGREDILSQCWPEYGEIISRWNEGTVLFGETGMTVVYSPYELGPYSMGEVELSLTYEELAPLVGEGGLRRLGVRPE